MRTVYIAFKKITKDSGLTSKMIGWQQGTKYSHVEIAFSETGNRPYKSIVAIRGLKTVQYIARFFNKEHWDMMEFHVTDDQYVIIEKVLDQIVGSKYDTLGIFGFVIPLKDRHDKWFCSEIVANALKVIGYEPMFLYDPSDIGIRELLYLLDFENNKLDR